MNALDANQKLPNLLEGYSDEELFEEIDRRYAAAVILYLDRRGSEEELMAHFSGGPCLANGMALQFLNRRT